MDHLFFELVKLLLKGLGYLVENFPDNPRLGRKLLLIGGVLVSTVFVPSTSPDWGDLILIFQSLSLITGGVCLILGAFIFFSALGVAAPGQSTACHYLIEMEMIVMEFQNLSENG